MTLIDEIVAEAEARLERELDEVYAKLVDYRIADGRIKPEDRELTIKQYRAIGERTMAKLFDDKRTDH